MKHFDNNETIKRIKSGDQKLWRNIYNLYKQEFSQWLGKEFSVEETVALEIFQSTMVTFYENIIKGKLEYLTSSLKTYLFAIGKNKAMETMRYDRRFVPANALPQVNVDDTAERLEFLEQKEEQIRKTNESLQKLGHPCSDILLLFYFEKRSLVDIAEKMGYRTMESLKSQKYKCMQRLKTIYFGM